MVREVNDSTLFDIDSSLTTLAHELKSPLALIRQLSLLIDSDLDPVTLDRVASQLRFTSDRTLKLVSDLTRAARLEDAMFEMAPINPRRICDDVLYFMQPAYKLKGSSLKVDYSNQQKLIVANQELLSSIIYNFCDNALNYSSDDSPASLFIRSAEDSKVRIGVRDHGPCLPLSVWRDIKRHGQVLTPQPIQARPGSSGLGLYIISRFAQAMCGQLGAIRHRDGTTLYIDLPVSNQLSML